jgi:BlaI family transcriptional regulator, penicillinase repressor
MSFGGLMPREAQDITEGELVVLQVLWERPAMSIRQITERLYPRRTSAHYGTVQKQLERLEGKGFVRRDRSLFVHLFSASVDREGLVGRRLDAVVDKLCSGSLAPVISHLLRAPKLTDAERRALRELIQGEDEGPDGQSPPRGKAHRKE